VSGAPRQHASSTTSGGVATSISDPTQGTRRARSGSMPACPGTTIDRRGRGPAAVGQLLLRRGRRGGPTARTEAARPAAPACPVSPSVHRLTVPTRPDDTGPGPGRTSRPGHLFHPGGRRPAADRTGPFRACLRPGRRFTRVHHARAVAPPRSARGTMLEPAPAERSALSPSAGPRAAVQHRSAQPRRRTRPVGAAIRTAGLRDLRRSP